METKRNFTYQELFDLEVFPNSKKVLISDHTGNSRWTEDYDLIFWFDNKYWKVSYVFGLTEMQDYSGSEHYPDMYQGEVECPQVEVYTEIVQQTKWREL